MKKSTKRLTGDIFTKEALRALAICVVALKRDVKAINKVLKNGNQAPQAAVSCKTKTTSARIPKTKKCLSNDITVTEFCRKYKGRPHRTTIQGWFRDDPEAVDYCKAYIAKGVWWADEKALDSYTKRWPLNKNPKKKR